MTRCYSRLRTTLAALAAAGIVFVVFLLACVGAAAVVYLAWTL